MRKVVVATVILGVLLLCGAALAKSKEEIVISGGDNALAGKFDPTLGYGVWSFDIFHCHLLKVGKENMLTKDLAVSEGRALVIVTHDQRIFQYADRIAHMDDGMIQETVHQ